MQVAGAMLQAGASAVPAWTDRSRPQTTANRAVWPVHFCPSVLNIPQRIGEFL